MEQDIILLYAKPYDMDTDDRGRVQGVSVRYLLTNSLQPIRDSVGNTVGIQVAKGSLDYFQFANITRAPAIYKGMFSLQTNGQGKVELKLTSVQYVCDLTGEVPDKKK